MVLPWPGRRDEDWFFQKWMGFASIVHLGFVSGTTLIHDLRVPLPAPLPIIVMQSCPLLLPSIFNSAQGSVLDLLSQEQVFPLSFPSPLISVQYQGNFICSVSQFSRSVVSHSLRPHELQHARPPCPSPTPGVYPNSCLFSRWCHLTISSSVVPFSSCPQSFPPSGSFQMS